MPFFWIGGLLATTGALHEPITLLVLPRLDAATALDLVARERATGIVGWPEDGWYHTGDRVYRREDDPRLFYVERTSELIKAAGANVSPLEVEAVIEQFADVAQCVVVGIDDPVRGEEVCAVVVPAVADLDVKSLVARTRDQLSAYKVPTRWALATSGQIPTLASGKLNRKGVLALVLNGTLEAVQT
jgi:acyl-CoA synthetase (AMP-forming)/AMP-acid ligase II